MMQTLTPKEIWQIEHDRLAAAGKLPRPASWTGPSRSMIIYWIMLALWVPLALWFLSFFFV
jgi:hypothetical protein